VFIGKEGPCATALKEIFISINQTPDDKISETLEALAEQAKKLTENENVVNGIIKELKQIDVKSTQASEKLASLNTNIKNEEKNSENLGCQINEISKNIDGLEVEFEMLRLREEDYNAKLGLRQDPNAKLGLREEDQKDWVEAKIKMEEELKSKQTFISIKCELASAKIETKIDDVKAYKSKVKMMTEEVEQVQHQYEIEMANLSDKQDSLKEVIVHIKDIKHDQKEDIVKETNEALEEVLTKVKHGRKKITESLSTKGALRKLEEDLHTKKSTLNNDKQRVTELKAKARARNTSI